MPRLYERLTVRNLQSFNDSLAWTGEAFFISLSLSGYNQRYIYPLHNVYIFCYSKSVYTVTPPPCYVTSLSSRSPLIFWDWCSVSHFSTIIPQWETTPLLWPLKPGNRGDHIRGTPLSTGASLWDPFALISASHMLCSDRSNLSLRPPWLPPCNLTTVLRVCGCCGQHTPTWLMYMSSACTVYPCKMAGTMHSKCSHCTVHHQRKSAVLKQSVHHSTKPNISVRDVSSDAVTCIGHSW